MELSLDLSLAFVPGRTVYEILGEVTDHSKDGSQRMAMIEDFVKRLEDEKKKIEAFKRELPLCMLLVNDAIDKLKEEINGGVRMKDEPVVEELIVGKESSDMKNWMNSVQLWNVETKQRNEEGDRCVPNNQTEHKIDTNKSGGASLGFNGNNKRVSKTVMKDEKEVSQVPSLMMSPVFELNNRKTESGDGHSSSMIITTSVEIKDHSLPQPNNPRKQRRCWSPDLHHRFVDALQQLGGPQVATPKQIRELMQVVGLTNDEVKSHLQWFIQKYRLHFRRPQSNFFNWPCY